MKRNPNHKVKKGTQLRKVRNPWGLEATPSELSASITSDFTEATEPESTTATEPGLFGDDSHALLHRIRATSAIFRQN